LTVVWLKLIKLLCCCCLSESSSTGIQRICCGAWCDASYSIPRASSANIQQCLPASCDAPLQTVSKAFQRVSEIFWIWRLWQFSWRQPCCRCKITSVVHTSVRTEMKWVWWCGFKVKERKNYWDWNLSALWRRKADLDGLDVLIVKNKDDADFVKWCMSGETEATWQRRCPKKTWWDCGKED